MPGFRDRCRQILPDHFLFLAAPFLFGAQLLLYAGGVVVLVVFAIRTRRSPFWLSRPSRPLTIAAIGAVVVAALLPLSPLAGPLDYGLRSFDVVAGYDEDGNSVGLLNGQKIIALLVENIESDLTCALDREVLNLAADQMFLDGAQN